MDDINDFMEDGDAGAPTPPEEPCDNREVIHTTRPALPVSSITGEQIPRFRAMLL